MKSRSQPLSLIHAVPIRRDQDTPLHAQLRQGLEQLLDQRFQDGDRFFTETALMETLRLSQSTVRRALSDLTASGRLRRVVAKGTFVRKAPAGAAATAKVVGIFLPECGSSHHALQLDAFGQACADRDLRLRLYNTCQGEAAVPAFEALDFGPAEGGAILFCHTEQTTCDLLAAMRSRGYRVVVVDNAAPGLDAPSVAMDSLLAVRMALTELRRKGHRRIALLLNEPRESGSCRERVEAFQRVAADLGLKNAQIWDCKTSRGGPESFRAPYCKFPVFLRAHPEVTAVLAISDSGALAALKACAEARIRVPQQLSVIGIDDEPACQLVFPSLSSLRQPYEEIARKAIELLFSSSVGRKRVRLAPTLVVRESVGKVRRRS